MRFHARALGATLVLGFATAGAVAAATPDVGTQKLGAANDIKMDVLAGGNPEPMNAQVVQQGDTIAIQIVEGGNVPPKAVAIANGTCPKPGAPVAKLPPFKGNQYQAFVHHAQLAKFMDGKHALVIYGSGSAIYACGTLNRPNALVH